MFNVFTIRYEKHNICCWYFLFLLLVAIHKETQTLKRSQMNWNTVVVDADAAPNTFQNVKKFFFFLAWRQEHSHSLFLSLSHTLTQSLSLSLFLYSIHSHYESLTSAYIHHTHYTHYLPLPFKVHKRFISLSLSRNLNVSTPMPLSLSLFCLHALLWQTRTGGSEREREGEEGEVARVGKDLLPSTAK